MHIAFLGSSLLSSYWNGAATYYRGLISALARRGWSTTFYEPDAFDRQKHRDMEPPDWAHVVVYPATLEAVQRVCSEAAHADVVVKASGVGVFDDEILGRLLAVTSADKIRIFWDVDAPATLAGLAADFRHPLRTALPKLDLVLTYGGGPPVVAGYRAFGARECVPIYNALDPTTHFPVEPDRRFEADLAFLGNRLPDREERVERFFFAAARALPERRFLIGGAGWEAWQLPPNVRSVGHVSTTDHNAFNATPLAVINIARDSMADTGYSPATRVFEAAGAGACIITDAWKGVELFLEPGKEILVARTSADVAHLVATLTRERAQSIGQQALRRILRDHTYEQRADQVVRLLEGALVHKRERAVA
jgi:spore maturation protein CgeB